MSGYRMRAIAAFAFLLLTCGPSMADDIVSSWSSVQVPAPPPLKTVTVDPSQTALLVLDFSKATCNTDKRPRCAATLPNVASLLTEARAHHLSIVFSVIPKGSIKDSPDALLPRAGEPVVEAGADKFVNTDLAAILKDKNIHTVIISGTISPGAVLFTASTAALRGFDVVVPVDTMSGNDAFGDLATAWILAHAAASVSQHVTLTRSDMIKY